MTTQSHRYRPLGETSGSGQRPARRLVAASLDFDLDAELTSLEQEPSWHRGDRNARTLVEEPGLRVTLTALKAGTRIPEHRTGGWVSIQALDEESAFLLIVGTADRPRQTSTSSECARSAREYLPGWLQSRQQLSAGSAVRCRPKRYAIWGKLIALQEQQIAYSIFDSRMVGRFIAPLYPPFTGRTIGELAAKLVLEPATLSRTVDCFNRSIRPGGTFDPDVLDDCCTVGLDPPKSHWAVPIAEPPFYGCPMRPNITFTYRGVAVDECTRVQLASGPTRNLYAAGEIMSGNILRQGYLAGFGLTIGTVSGRIAGSQAATQARR